MYFAKLHLVIDSSQGIAQMSNFWSCEYWILAGSRNKGPLPKTEFSGFKSGFKFSLKSGVFGFDPVAHVVRMKIFTESS